MASNPYPLKVRTLGGTDMYKDMIRVHHTERNNLENGAIIRVKVNDGKPHILALRGCLDEEKGTVGLDFLNQQHMKLKHGQEYQFSFEGTNPLEKLKWAANSADPAARVATWIAIMSAIIGILGLLLGIAGLVMA
jgi:hypothetical protein